MKRQATPPVSSEQLEMMLLSVMPERNRGEWKETGDSDFAYEIGGLGRFRGEAAPDRERAAVGFRLVPAHGGSGEQPRRPEEVQPAFLLSQGVGVLPGAAGPR